MDTAETVAQLVSDLEVLSLSSSTSPSSSVPSLQQFYQLGLVLYRVTRDRNSRNDHPIILAYRQLIESLSDETLLDIFDDLRRAAKKVLESRTQSNPTTMEDWSLAVRSICGLIDSYTDIETAAVNGEIKSYESNSRLCRVVYHSDWIAVLSAYYDRFVVAISRQTSLKNEVELNEDALLSALSRLLLDGLLLAGTPARVAATVEESFLEAIRVMEEESTDCLRDLQFWQDQSERERRTLEDSIRNMDESSGASEDERLERAQQREYIASMLESARSEPSSTAVAAVSNDVRSKTVGKPTSSTKPIISAPETELDRRIRQVLQILPQFGEGFVEVALGLHQGDVQATVATLLQHDDSSTNTNYPNALRVLDPNLPRRKQEFQTYRSRQEEAESALQARQDVKDRIQKDEEAQQAAYEALMVVTSSEPEAVPAATSTSDPPIPKQLTRKERRQQKLQELMRKAEYDDDYDDQYDEVDIKLGSADDGFATETSTTVATMEQIKLYNRLVQEDESDVSFWESNKNTNHSGGNKGKNKSWGPDKIKGGKIIGEDGKIVRKPGGVKKKNKSKGTNNGNANNSNNDKKKGFGGNAKPNPNPNTKGVGDHGSANNTNKKKPQTKPKRDNRVNRQRDRKMKKQGAFGVQD